MQINLKQRCFYFCGDAKPTSGSQQELTLQRVASKCIQVSEEMGRNSASIILMLLSFLYHCQESAE